MTEMEKELHAIASVLAFTHKYRKVFEENPDAADMQEKLLVPQLAAADEAVARFTALEEPLEFACVWFEGNGWYAFDSLGRMVANGRSIGEVSSEAMKFFGAAEAEYDVTDDRSDFYRYVPSKPDNCEQEMVEEVDNA